MLLGVPEIHPEQLLGEQRGLLATGPCPDLEDDVAVVVRIARQQETLQVLEHLRLRPLGRVALPARDPGNLLVGLATPKLPDAVALPADRKAPPIRLDHGLEPAQ